MNKNPPPWQRNGNTSMVFEKCEKLSNLIVSKDVKFRDELFPEWRLNGQYSLFYKSIDLIQDSDNAIESFYQLSDKDFQSHSTIFIYGLMQAFICQQDGLYSLCKSLKNQKEIYQPKSIYDFLNYFCTEKDENGHNRISLIRWHRNNIAGHPTDKDYKDKNEFDSFYYQNIKAKNEKIYYFLSKGRKSKTSIEYAGNNPTFLSFEFNPMEQIKLQRKFSENVLDFISNILEKSTSDYN